MELIIEIPEEIYQRCKEVNTVIDGRGSSRRFSNIILNAIKNGEPVTPHPKIERCKDCK